MTQWRDTPQHYGTITRILHWMMAGLILWQILGMTLRLLFGRTPVVAFFVGSHATVGFMLMGLVLLRAAWVFVNRGNRPPHAPGMVGLAARAGHVALYGLMLTIPALALLRAWGNTRPFAVWGIEIFGPREAEIGWAVQVANLLHGELGWLLAALIAGHVLMVAVHEGLWRDGTLAKMAGRRQA